MLEEILYLQNPWWENKNFDSGLKRPAYISLLSDSTRKQIEVLIGSRRAGKTTILKQLIKECLDNGINPNEILYIALDHPRLESKRISELIHIFRGIFSHSLSKKIILFLDEVQESSDWQNELKAIYDLENVKIYASGSTSALIRNQGGKLTGRQIITHIYPLSFEEFISFKNIQISKAETYRYEKIVEEYLQTGGYPENVLSPSDQYLQNLLDDIIARDIIRIFQIRKAPLLKDLFRLLAASVGSRISYSKLSRILGISVDTVKEYVGYFEDAFLVKTLEKWTSSYSEKVYAARKVYLMDTGLKTLITGRGDLGAKAESVVNMKFVRENKEVGYFADSEREVDFILGNIKNPTPIEVKYDSSFDWQNKRFSGLKLFLKRYPQTKKAFIITKNIEASITEKQTHIQAVPLWKWLLQD